MVIRHLSIKISSHSPMVLLICLAKGRLAQIKVDHKYIGTLESHAGCDILNNKCLTCIRVE